ncbi:MAG: hypothetical protein E7308_04650 [Butyrivibrio sp.]|nr:hypothetical protein [Butyrivibrio sp.]
MDKKNYYTKSQALAIKKYLSNKAEIKLRMSPSQKELLQKEAQSKNMSVNAYVLNAVGNQISLDNEGQNLEPKLITNMISWLKSHNISDSDIVDFLSYIARE